MNCTNDVVEIAKSLVSINSDYGKEREIGNYIFDFLTDLDLKPIKQPVSGDRFNVIVQGTSDLLITGHMDVVPVIKEKWKFNPYGEIKDEKLYGRGSSDTKGNYAPLLAALKKNPSNKFSLLFNTGEEVNFDGMLKAMSEKEKYFPNIKYAIVLEPSDFKITVAHKGILKVEAEAFGKAAHSSTPERGDNAIMKIKYLIDRLEKYSQEISKRKSKYVKSPTLNIGTISGGTRFNVVPAQCKIEFDRRIVPEENVDEVIEEIKNVSIPIEPKILFRLGGFAVDSEYKTIDVLKHVYSLLNLNFEKKGTEGTMELRVIKDHGIEPISVGCGSLDMAHIDDEYVEIKNLKLFQKVFEKLFEIYK